VSADDKRRAKEKIARVADRGLDLVGFWRECKEPLASAIPHYWSPCCFTLDPASLLVTSHFDEGIPELPPDWGVREYLDDDVHKLADVARSERGVSTLHEVTAGDPSGTPRWKANIALGGDQEMITALRTRAGDVWGAIAIYREPGDPFFEEEDLSFMRAVSPHLAEGARRALLIGEASDPDGDNAPGLIVLSPDWAVESTSPGVERWVADLPDGDLDAGRLPSSVTAVAARALRSAERPDEPGEVAVSRVLSNSGTWIVLHGATLVSGDSRRVAVIVEPAHPARISSLLMSAYGLSEREQDVTRLVLQGNATTEIAGRLAISPHTVQQHLKNVFAKTGVRSRRDLVGKVFFSHYEPRLRDNERRALEGRPMRGEPAAGTAPS
jgi:DNA-binding CsgD family transcriptional regulator